MALGNPFGQVTPNSPANDGVAVTPADGSDLTGGICKSLYIGGTGNVNVDTANGTTVVFAGLPAGSILPVRVKRVRSTSTTATSIVALYD